jgi:cell division protein FtsB
MMARRLRVDYGWTSVLIKIAYVLFFLAAVAGVAYYYVPLIKKTRLFENELEKKQAALREEEELNSRLKREIKLLKEDPDYVEKVVRDKLGYAREGEGIYRFESLEERQRKEQEAARKKNQKP